MTTLPKEETTRTRRLAFLIACVLVFATALAGCAADEEAGEEEDPGVDEEDPGTDEEDPGVGDDAGTTPEVVELFVTAHDDPESGEFWFEVEELEGRNPKLTLEEGAEVRIHFENVGSVGHNLHLGGAIGMATDVIPAGEVALLNFTVPSPDEEDADGVAPLEDTLEDDDDQEDDFYWCDPHFGQGMWGELEIVEEGGVGETGEGEDEGVA